MTKRKKSTPGPEPMFGEKMEHRLIVVLSETDFKEVMAAVKKSGKSRSTWGREAVLAAARAEVKS